VTTSNTVQLPNDFFDFDFDAPGASGAAAVCDSTADQPETEETDADAMGLMPEPTAVTLMEARRKTIPVPQRAAIRTPDNNSPDSGSSSTSIEFLYLDIETVPDYSREHLFSLPPVPVVPEELPENCLMPAEEFLSQTLGEIEKWFSHNNPPESWLQLLEVQERKASGKKGNRKGLFDAINKAREAKSATDDGLRANRKRMATCPEMCEIVCLGLAADDGEVITLLAGEDGVTEVDILTAFWAMAAKSQCIVGFNSANFDLPTIFFRSMLHGVPATRRIDLSSYRDHVLDLQIARFGKYPEKGFGLKNVARLCNIDVPCEGVDGSQVERLMVENPMLVKQYQASDIIVTRSLHRAYSGYFCR
jgi:hypothetical protein